MKSRDIVHISLFAALTAALGLLPAIPVPLIAVPITAQTLGVMLAGALLGARRGALAMLLFMALVAAGLPILSGGRGGLAVFAGPTVGFFLAFPFAAFFIGWCMDRLWPRFNIVQAFAVNVVGGIGLIYLFGIPLLGMIAGLQFGQAAWASLAFLPGDLLKAGAAAAITAAVRRGYPSVRAGSQAAIAGNP